MATDLFMDSNPIPPIYKMYGRCIHVILNISFVFQINPPSAKATVSSMSLYHQQGQLILNMEMRNYLEELGCYVLDRRSASGDWWSRCLIGQPWRRDTSDRLWVWIPLEVVVKWKYSIFSYYCYAFKILWIMGKEVCNGGGVF